MIVDYTEELGFTLIHVFMKGNHYTERFVPYYFEPNPLGKIKTIDNKTCSMITKLYPREVGKSRSPFSYEADILFPHRWILDRVKEIDTQYSYLCIDIENSSEFMPKEKELVNKGHSKIYSIAMYYKNPWEDKTHGTILYLNPFPGTSFPVNKGKADKIYVYDSEDSLFFAFNRLVISYDPDILTGWNFKRYDAPYLLYRMKKLGIQPEWGRLGKPTYLNNRGEVRIWGRAIVDAQEMYRTKRRLKENISWRLEYISQKENLSASKLKLPGKGSRKYEIAWRNYPDTFADYNYHDVLSASELFDKDFPMYMRLQQVIFQQIDKLFSTNQVTSSILLRIAGKVRSPRQVLPTAKEHSSKRIKGAEVFDPRAGYFEDVYVPDYVSYYPNIVKTFNMSMETVGGGCRLFNGHSFDLSRKGLLAEATDYLLEERFKNKELRSNYNPKSYNWEYYDIIQKAYKVAADAMYGATKNPYFRMHSRPVAESITYVGREGIKIAKREAEKVGTVLRGDTDGIAMIDIDIDKFIADFEFENFIAEICFGDIPNEVTIELDKGDFYPKFYSTPEKKHYFFYDEHGHFGQKGYFKADLPHFAEPFQTELFTGMLDNRGVFPQDVYLKKKSEYLNAELEQIGFPRRFPGAVDFKRAIQYAEDVLNLKFEIFDRPLSFNVKSTGTYKHIDQIIVNDVEDIPSEFVIDRRSMWEKLCGKALGDTISKMRSDVVILNDW